MGRVVQKDLVDSRSDLAQLAAGLSILRARPPRRDRSQVYPLPSMALRASIVRLTYLGLLGILISCGGGEKTEAPTSAVRISLTLSNDTLPIGGASVATARGTDGAGKEVPLREVSWSTSDPTIVSVNTRGIVTALSAGTAQVVAAAGSLVASRAVVVFAIRAADVIVTPLEIVMAPGDSARIDAVPVDASGARLGDRTIRWLSSDTTKVVVSANGVLHARASGVTRVNAIADSVFGSVAVRVSGPAGPVDRVTVLPSAATVRLGSLLRLTALLEDAEGDQATDRVVTWRSLNPAVATVNSAGGVTPITPGSTRIIATAEGREGTALIVVSDPKDDIAISCSKPDSTDVVGDTLEVVCNPRGSSAIVKVTARVELVSRDLVFGLPSARGLLPLWWSNLDVTEVRYGNYQVLVEATDDRGNTGIRAIPFTRGARKGTGGTSIPPRNK